LLVHLKKADALHFHFKWSIVTKKFRKQIRSLMLFGFAGSVVGAIKIAFDSIVLSSLEGLESAATYALVGFAASLLQAPFRSVISVSFPALVLAWKNKDMLQIDRIYKRSSINLLIFSLFIFGLIWLNFETVILYFNLNPEYINGKWVLLILCIAYIIEMGTGLNAQIIQSSSMWRFEFYTNMLLAFIIAPCTYLFTKWYGIIGPAFATLLGLIIYNGIRIIFLKQKFNFFPFTVKTMIMLICFTGILVLILMLRGYLTAVAYFFTANLFYCISICFCILYFNLSPDVKPVVNNIFKRLKIRFRLP
jgi:O-antigen/teichoic acid export membrane protein